jgi:hypothetical protein
MRNLSVIVMTVIGDAPRDWLHQPDDTFPAPPGFLWRFVPEGSLPTQLRSILRLDACGVVVWVNGSAAVDRAANLIGRLLETGPPMVIAIADPHDAQTELALRQTGALYLCGHEAQGRLTEVLESALDPPSRSADMRPIKFRPAIKMDDS